MQRGIGKVAYAKEIWVRLRQICEPEEGLHATVGAELDVEGCFAGAGHGDVEGFDDLGCDSCTGDSADGISGTRGMSATCPMIFTDRRPVLIDNSFEG